MGYSDEIPRPTLINHASPFVTVGDCLPACTRHNILSTRRQDILFSDDISFFFSFFS